MKKLAALIILTAFLVLFSIQIAEAYQIDESYRPINSPFELNKEIKKNPITSTQAILEILAGGLLYFAAPVAIIMIAIGGFNMVVGGAESEKLEEAKKHLTWSVVGLGLIILSYSAVRIAIQFAISVADVTAK